MLADDAVIGLGRLAGIGDLLQLCQRRISLEFAPQPGSGQHRAHARVLRLQLGGAGEEGIGPQRVSLLQPGLGRQHEQAWSDCGPTHERREGCAGLVWLAESKLGLCEVVTSTGVGWRQADRARQLGLCLYRRAHLQFVDARSYQRRHVLGRKAEEGRELVPGQCVVALQVIQARLHIQTVQIARPSLGQLVLRLSGGLQVAAVQLNHGGGVQRL